MRYCLNFARSHQNLQAKFLFRTLSRREQQTHLVISLTFFSLSCAPNVEHRECSSSDILYIETERMKEEIDQNEMSLLARRYGILTESQTQHIGHPLTVIQVLAIFSSAEMWSYDAFDSCFYF